MDIYFKKDCSWNANVLDTFKPNTSYLLQSKKGGIIKNKKDLQRLALGNGDIEVIE